VTPSPDQFGPSADPARVLVTGGAGFIGSHVVEKLLAAGACVTVLDDLSTGDPANLPLDPRLRLVRGDAADPDAMADAIAGCSRAVHLAAVASVERSVVDPIGTHRSNLVATLQLLEACRRAGVPRVVYASSAAVYGDLQRPPVRESGALAPSTPYAIDKLAGETYLGYYRREHGISSRALRFFNVYGPRQRSDSPYSGVISLFMQRALAGSPVTIFGDGLQTRDFVFVEDVAAAIVASLAAPTDDAAPVMNVGSGTGTSLLQLLEAIERLSDHPVERRFESARSGDIRDSVADVTVLQETLDAFVATDLSTGLARLAESLKPNS
jgi:UDP-glucose 4-epimerase